MRRCSRAVKKNSKPVIQTSTDSCSPSPVDPSYRRFHVTFQENYRLAVGDLVPAITSGCTGRDTLDQLPNTQHAPRTIRSFLARESVYYHFRTAITTHQKREPAIAQRVKPPVIHPPVPMKQKVPPVFKRCPPFDTIAFVV